MYEKLVKDLRYLAKVYSICENENMKEYNLAVKAADAIEDLQKQIAKSEIDNINLTGWLAEEHVKHQWVPATERLPDLGKEVFVYLFCSNSPYIAWVNENGEWETEDFLIDDFDDNPIAWMPLPKPYKGE